MKTIALSLAVFWWSVASCLHAFARAVDHLPAVRLALAQEGRDLGVVVVEGLLQQEGRAFLRTQPLQHGQEG